MSAIYKTSAIAASINAVEDALSDREVDWHSLAAITYPIFKQIGDLRKELKLAKDLTGKVIKIPAQILENLDALDERALQILAPSDNEESPLAP